MLTLAQETYDAIVAHAKRDHPDEACGVVAGPEGSDRAERFVPMVNAAGSPTFYEFDSTELLALYKDMDARDDAAGLVGVVALGVRHDGVEDLLGDGQHTIKGRQTLDTTRTRLTT